MNKKKVRSTLIQMINFENFQRFILGSVELGRLLLLWIFFLLAVDFCVSSIKSVERTFEYNAAGFPIEIHYNLMRGRNWKEN